MHALTRSTSGMYAWQSRIASGSQAARCSGVHCCAAAGPDAHVSARPRSAVGSAAAAMIGQSFACAIRISIIDPPVDVLRRYLPSIQRAWQAALACCGESLRDRGTAQLEVQYRWLMGSSSAGNKIGRASCRERVERAEGAACTKIEKG